MIKRKKINKVKRSNLIPTDVLKDYEIDLDIIEGIHSEVNKDEIIEKRQSNINDINFYQSEVVNRGFLL